VSRFGDELIESLTDNLPHPLPTLKGWEQGRRHPDAPAAAYLRAIAKRPNEISAASLRTRPSLHAVIATCPHVATKALGHVAL
jgi:hypothetical protein